MARRISNVIVLALLIGLFSAGVSAATISRVLQAKLASVSDATSVGMVIVAFNTNSGLSDGHLNALRSVGITRGFKLQHLDMIGFHRDGHKSVVDSFWRVGRGEARTTAPEIPG